MQLHLNTEELSELDHAIIAAIHNHRHGNTPAKQAENPAPAQKVAPAPKQAEKPAPAPAPAPEATPADVPAASGDAPTLEDAVAAATKLVSSGQAAKVKAALSTVGAKRVSELNEGDIPAFLAALDA